MRADAGTGSVRYGGILFEAQPDAAKRPEPTTIRIGSFAASDRGRFGQFSANAAADVLRNSFLVPKRYVSTVVKCKCRKRVSRRDTTRICPQAAISLRFQFKIRLRLNIQLWMRYAERQQPLRCNTCRHHGHYL